MWAYIQEGRELLPMQVSPLNDLPINYYTNNNLFPGIARWMIAVFYALNAFTLLTIPIIMSVSSLPNNRAAVAIVATRKLGLSPSAVRFILLQNRRSHPIYHFKLPPISHRKSSPGTIFPQSKTFPTGFRSPLNYATSWAKPLDMP